MIKATDPKTGRALEVHTDPTARRSRWNHHTGESVPLTRETFENIRCCSFRQKLELARDLLRVDGIEHPHGLIRQDCQTALDAANLALVTLASLERLAAD